MTNKQWAVEDKIQRTMPKASSLLLTGHCILPTVYLIIMQFRVPQFIDMEDKIVGPLTLKQFGYILGAGGISFLIWTFIPIKTIAVILIVLISGLFLSLAFLKINNRPFTEVLENAFAYYSGSKIYTWKQPEEKITSDANIEKTVADAAKEVTLARVNKNRLHEISLGLDVFDRSQEKESSK